jgi:hypothetical protein
VCHPPWVWAYSTGSFGFGMFMPEPALCPYPADLVSTDLKYYILNSPSYDGSCSYDWATGIASFTLSGIWSDDICQANFTITYNGIVP